MARVQFRNVRGMRPLLFSYVLRFLPKKKVSDWVGKITDIHLPLWLLNLLIKTFIKYYQIDMSEVATSSFKTFNEFFTRPLLADSRPIAEGDNVVSPVDGVIGSFGKIEGTTLFQAKGISYSLRNLVINPDYVSLFADGLFVTLYLSPRHYHRIHAPIAGNIQELFYIPGSLYPVNNFAVEHIPSLFTINERLISIIDHGVAGKVAVIKVGATNVGKIKVVYDDVMSNSKRYSTVHRKYSRICIAKGEELGRFLMGSTVILLFEKDRISFDNLATGNEIRLGETIATVVS